MAEKEKYIKPSQEKIREKLTDMEYTVTQEEGTEPPFTGKYWDHFEKGLYVDIVTGEPLFLSSDKYRSSCGWPAFQRTVSDDAVNEKKDSSFGMVRTEVSSKIGESHLGHVFENDPESPNGIRYCIDSASIRFIPYDELEAAGYGEYKSLLGEKR